METAAAEATEGVTAVLAVFDAPKMADTSDGDVESALREAEVVVDQTYTTPHEHNNPMEPHACIALWDNSASTDNDGPQLMLYDSTQGVHAVSAAMTALAGSFNANIGQDAAGAMFGRQYVNTSRDLLKAATAGINACRNIGYGIGVSAVNYSRADAASDISGRSQPLAPPPCPAPVSAPGAPSATGSGTPEPALWKVVALFVGDLWPNGDPAAMRTAAGSWRSFSDSLYHVSGAMSVPYNVIGAQQMPEAELIQTPIRDIGTGLSSVGGACRQLAAELEAFATNVEQTQQAIRPRGVRPEVMVFTGSDYGCRGSPPTLVYGMCMVGVCRGPILISTTSSSPR